MSIFQSTHDHLECLSCVQVFDHPNCIVYKAAMNKLRNQPAKPEIIIPANRCADLNNCRTMSSLAVRKNVPCQLSALQQQEHLALPRAACANAHLSTETMPSCDSMSRTHTFQDVIENSLLEPPRMSQMQSLLVEAAEIGLVGIQETSLGGSGRKTAVDAGERNQRIGESSVANEEAEDDTQVERSKIRPAMCTKGSNKNEQVKISSRDYDKELSHDTFTREDFVGRENNMVNVHNEEELENTKIDRPQHRKHNRQNVRHLKSKLVAHTSNDSRKTIIDPMSCMRKKRCDDISRNNHQSMPLEKDITDQNVYVNPENSDVVVEADGEDREFFKCGFSECHSSYCDELSLNRHTTKAHQSMKLYPCYYCSCLWSDRKHLLAHLLSHIGPLPHRCVQCDICFAKRSFLRDHLNKMHQVNKPFKCQFAGCKFVSNVWTEFKAHNSIIHPREDAYRCFACKTEITTLEAYFEHIEMYMVTLICCSYCAVKSRMRQTILRHSNTIHQGLDVRFTMQTTVKCVSATTELQAPKSTPTSTISSQQALIRNVACGGESSMGEQVVCHESGSNLNLAFRCSLCPFVSAELQHYSMHLARHCSKTSHCFRHYKCVHCQFTTNVMALIEEHLQENHENELFKFEVQQEFVKSNTVSEYVHSSSDASSDTAQLAMNTNNEPQSITGVKNKHVHYGVMQGASGIQPKYAKCNSSQSVSTNTGQKYNNRRSRTECLSCDIGMKRKLLIVLDRCDVLMGTPNKTMSQTNAEQNNSAGGNEDMHSPTKIQKLHNGTRAANNSKNQENIEASAQKSRDETDTKMRNSQTDIYPEMCDSKDDTCTGKHDSQDDNCTWKHDSQDDTRIETHDSQDDIYTETHDTQDDTCTEKHDYQGNTCTETHDSQGVVCTEKYDSRDVVCTEKHDSRDVVCTDKHDSPDVVCTETQASQDDILLCTEKHDSRDIVCKTRDSQDDTSMGKHDSQDETYTEKHDSQDDISTETHDCQDNICTETHDSRDDTYAEAHDSRKDTRTEILDFQVVNRTYTIDPQDATCTETSNSCDDTCTETQYDTSTELQHPKDSLSSKPSDEPKRRTGPVDAVKPLNADAENTILCRVPEQMRYRCNVCIFHCQMWEIFKTHMAEAHYYRIVKPDATSPLQNFIAVPIKKTNHTLNPHRCSLYVCDDCSFTTDVKGNFQRHMEGHSEKLPSGYKCSFCSYSSVHKFIITRHAKKYHTYELLDQPYDVSILSKKIVAIGMANLQTTTTECSKPIERNIKLHPTETDLPLSGTGLQVSN